MTALLLLALTACGSDLSVIAGDNDAEDNLPENTTPGDTDTTDTDTTENDTTDNGTIDNNAVIDPPVPTGTGLRHNTLVSEFASFNMPGVLDGRVEAIAIDGDTVYVGGSFTQVQNPFSNEIINQPYLFAYSKLSGQVLREFDPVLNNAVYALETTGEGSGIFVGGVFNELNGEISLRGLVKIHDNGDRMLGFDARPDALVTSLVRHGTTLYAGGNFDSISGIAVENLAAINVSTGAVLPDIALDFDGVLSTASTRGVQGIDDMDISSDGKLLVVAGNFSIVDGLSRPRLAAIELNGQAQVSNWNTNVFDIQCPNESHPQYILGLDISPDDGYLVVGTTGFRILGNPACDTVTRYELTNLDNNDVQPTWVNFTGGDTIYEVVSTGHAVYAGGHFQFLDNDFGNGSVAGPGSTARAGLAALDPLNGLTVQSWKSDRNPRGLGTFALIPADDGLYIGDDTDFLNGSEHRKLKFLPVSNQSIARPTAPALPATILTSRDDALDGSLFRADGIDPPQERHGTGWQDARGGMVIGNELFHADNNGRLWKSLYINNALQAREPVDLFGQSEEDWALSRLTGMFFDYAGGQVYYTLQGDSRLLRRAFSPDGTFFGNDEFVAQHQADIAWADISGMDVINDHLYFARNDGTLYRAQMRGANVLSNTTVALSGPGIDGRNWANNLLAFLGDGQAFQPPVKAQFEFESSGSQTIGRTREFEFPVAANEPTLLRLQWRETNAALDLFVRDANGANLALDNSANGSPKQINLPAGSGGTYTAVVVVQQDATSYTLQVNPVE